jgi:hypothetical protein
MTLLSRRLPSGRIINVDAGEAGVMMRGGKGWAHVDMDNGNNNINNLKVVDELTAREMLMEFSESQQVHKSEPKSEPKSEDKSEPEPEPKTDDNGTKRKQKVAVSVETSRNLRSKSK